MRGAVQAAPKIISHDLIETGSQAPPFDLRRPFPNWALFPLFKMSRQTNEDRVAWNKTLIVRRTVGIVAMSRLN
jgi:hypothetical protein